ncbi:hypothetical protein [Sporosarcina sp. E16_8]|uniref:hypothetical protein n=1 Tax=Sporosarcina sp. E16_8 TaxID=2789295 RepID=UPI001A9158EB|nr:hypothetical protein [Sporosarcina sp. E16_8]MBO0588909.1 hypothetical protein [Sporosarcina sp. E16_8]
METPFLIDAFLFSLHTSGNWLQAFLTSLDTSRISLETPSLVGRFSLFVGHFRRLVAGFSDLVGHFGDFVGNSFVGWTLFSFRWTLPAIG